MLLKLLVGLVMVLGVLSAYVASRPTAFQVARSLAISARPELVFPYVNNFRKWSLWSPWDKFDPNMTKAYEGPAEGAGAVYRWSGNGHVGEGSALITESRPFERIRIRLQFKRPFACVNPVEFTFQARGKDTIVTWNMTGEYNFATKAMGLVMNMDKMTGDQFAEGLLNLQRVVEVAPG